MKSPFENQPNKILIYYTKLPNCHKDEVKEAPVHHTSARDDMKHATGIIVGTTISIVDGLCVV
jgi:hypothetical protein